MNIYFAGSIRGGRNDKELYAQIIAVLSSFGKVLTEHIGDKTLSALGEDGPTDTYIYDRDMEWLKKTDVVVAEVTTPSLGVGYEIAKAEEWGKKILCIYREVEGRKVSAMISGNNSSTLKVYKTLADIKVIVNDFLNK